MGYGDGGYGEGPYGLGPAQVPTLQEVAEALKKDPSDLQMTYFGELEAQARACVTTPYSWDLGRALIRRVARARAMENLPLGVVQDESGSTRLGSVDPEIRRLEAPHRRVSAIG